MVPMRQVRVSQTFWVTPLDCPPFHRVIARDVDATDLEADLVLVARDPAVVAAALDVEDTDTVVTITWRRTRDARPVNILEKLTRA